MIFFSDFSIYSGSTIIKFNILMFFFCFCFCLQIAVNSSERASPKTLIETYIENEKALKKVNSFKIKLPDKSPTNSTNKKKKEDLNLAKNKDKMLLEVLNRFIFYSFFVYILFLNIICLYFLPYHIRKELSINNSAF